MTVKPIEVVQPTNGQILVATYDTNVLDSGKWLQEVIAGTNTDKVQGPGLDHLPQGGKNWIVNGGMEYWFSGSTFTATTAYVHTGNGYEIYQCTAARDTGTFDVGSTASMAVTPAVAFANVLQYITNPQELRNRTVTVRARIKTASTVGVYMYLQDDTGVISTVRPLTATSGFATMIAEATVSANTNSLILIFAPLDTTPFWIDNVSLQPGYGAMDFFPQPPAIAYLMMDNRRGTGTFNARFRSGTAAVETETFWVSYRGTLDAAPAVTITYTPNPGVTDNNIASLTVISSTVDGCNIQVTPTAANLDTYIIGATLTWDTNI